MANKIQSIDLDKTPKSVLQSILDACERIDANELGLKDFYRGTTVTWSIPELGINYQNTTTDEFNQIIKNSTNEDSISRAYAEIYEKVQKLEKGTPEMKGAEESPVDANMLTKDQQETLNEASEKTLAEKKASNDEQIRQVRESIEQQKTQAEKVKATLVDEKTFSKTPTAPQQTTTTPEPQQVAENITPTSVYLSNTTTTVPQNEEDKVETIRNAVEKESDLEKIHVKESIHQIRAALAEKQKAYSDEITKAKQVQNSLQGKPVKVYVKVPESKIETNPEAQALKQMAIANPQQFVKDTSAHYQSRSILKDLPANEAKMVADDAALTTYETLRGGSPIIQTATVHAIINNPTIMGKISTDQKVQSEIRKQARGIANSRTSQRDLYKQFVESQKIEGMDSDNVIVQTSETPQPGYVEIDGRQLIKQNITNPYIESLENQSNALNYVGQELSGVGIDGVKSRILDKVGVTLSNKIASLPQDSALAKAYNSKVVQYGLSRVGLVTPSAWTAAESSWLGNLLVSTGHGELGGLIQGIIPGLNLGLVPATPIFNEFGSVALSIIGPETTAVPAVQAIVKTTGQIGKQSLNVALGNAVAKGASSVALRFGFTAASAKIGAAVGTGIMPVVGTIVGVALGTVFGKLIERYGPQIQKFFNEYGKYFLGVGIVAGFMGIPLLAAPLLLIGGASVLASGIGFAGVGLGIFTFFKSVGGAILFAITAPIIITIITIPLFVALVLFIINSNAYVVPPQPFEAGREGAIPADCAGEPPAKPEAGEVRLSSDGRYAYPVGRFPNPPYSGAPKGCFHWDGNKAADLFNSPNPRSPLLAFEGGKIVNVTLNDSDGGKYVILQGTTSGRYYYYAHLCHAFVSSGETVGVGDVIGTMDETGTGRVEHLHFAINSSSLGDTFIGGDGDICPYEDFEEKFDFGICSPTNSCVSP